MENEGNEATPAEQLAAEVASDAEEQTGGVTEQEVADLLHLPQPEASDSKDNKADESEAEADENAEDKEADNDEEADGASDDADDGSDNDADEENDDNQEENGPPYEDGKQFTLEVVDVNGEKFVLKPGDNLEEKLKDFEPKNNGQIMQVLRDFDKLEGEKAKYDQHQEEQAAETAKQEKISNIRAGWDKEIEHLQGDKRLPVEADGKISERVKEVFNFMSTENEKRVKERRPLLESFEDALDKLELRESKDEVKQKDKEERELARKRGAIVGGSSAAASNGTSKYTRGSARTATEALKVQGIL